MQGRDGVFTKKYFFRKSLGNMVGSVYNHTITDKFEYFSSIISVSAGEKFQDGAN